eukprot:symbB.v1.2.008681.t1/scaffold539.1/size189864/13
MQGSTWRRSGVIFGYSAGGTYSPPSSGAVYLVPPQSEASAPVPVVAGPRLVDYCTTLELDASASRNTAGQPNVSWHLHGVQCYAFEGEEPSEGYCNTTLMELAMEDTASALLQIEAAERPPELQFVLIEAVVTNRWGVSEHQSSSQAFLRHHYLSAITQPFSGLGASGQHQTVRLRPNAIELGLATTLRDSNSCGQLR